MRNNPDFDQWYTDELLSKWCQMAGLPFHHCDTFMPQHYMELEQPIVGETITAVVGVIYGGQYSEWVAAVRANGEFVVRIDPVAHINYAMAPIVKAGWELTVKQNNRVPRPQHPPYTLTQKTT